ncbi:ABC transporter ATP-binding protein [Bradyrhizobium brasilense]|uniref:ABC transporter ATP-binding protein n=1 Tax=Bradyrhizobium brasilense TaxID=1419277 RepID=UPI0014575FC0|nr:ABC transporter ATP-binding protein [Bradyrhizobium brasilense]NLS75254.1 ABC transporter ATP-binding protein [Bradyrhizobium brasilense]
MLQIHTQGSQSDQPVAAKAEPEYILDVRDLAVDLKTEDGIVSAVAGFSLRLSRGSTVCIVGESGCGKSITARALLRLLPDNGRITAGEARLRAGDGSIVDLTREEANGLRMRSLRGQDMAIIFQEPMTSLSPIHTIGDQITEMIHLHSQVSHQEARRRAVDLLSRVGIPRAETRLDAYTFQLSGGMRQRAMIAMALANRPQFLIADEPTTALDVTTQAQILDLLRELRADYGMGMMFITHDLGVVAEMADEVVVMYLGAVVERANVRNFFRSPRHPYSQALLRSTPRADGGHGRLQTIPGTVPDPLNRPQGCTFNPRCQLRIRGLCEIKEPPTVPLADGTDVRCWLYAPEQGEMPITAQPAMAGDMPQTLAVPASVPVGRAVIEVKDLKMHFGIGKGLLRRVVGAIRAVDGIDLDIREGETLGIVGESGSGKTTLGKSIIRIYEPTSGKVNFHQRDRSVVDLAHLRSQDLKAPRRDIRMIFQDPYSSLNPRATVGEIIAEPLVVNKILSGAALEARVCELLERVGLRAEYRHRYPHAFSGGQRQRIGIARALALEPRVIICDEAVSALDVSVQAQILNLLDDLQKEFGFTYLFIAHDLSVVRHICNRTAVMYFGRIVEIGETDRLFERPMHPYTEALLSAVPVPDPDANVKERRIVLKGEIPDPSNPPSGCPFHTRCRYSDGQRCVSEVPELALKKDGRNVACHHAESLELRGQL